MREATGAELGRRGPRASRPACDIIPCMPASDSTTRPNERLTPATAIDKLAGVGRRRAERFARLGITTVGDLLRHLPMRYEHEQGEGTISELTIGAIGAARGAIAAARWVGGRARGKGRFEATLEDSTGSVLLTWFNAPYIADKLHPGQGLRVQGKVKQYGVYRQMVNPKWETLDETADPPAKDEKQRPIYPATEELPSSIIERVISDVLPRVLGTLTDPLPEALRKHHEMPTLAEAYRMAHQPEHGDEPPAARRRLAYNELLLLQLGITMKRAFVRSRLHAPALHYSEAIDQHIRARFPFALTQSQQQVIEQIVEDVTQPKPMNRLLQGDVGSGKTVVALYALLLAVAGRRQGALMAPTELLAEQHYASISAMLEGSNVRMMLLTGGQAPANSARRREMLETIERGEVDIIVGTHALISDKVQFHDLALAVIDEQHRFGVVQRAGFRTNTAREKQDEADQQPPPDEADTDASSANHQTRVPHYLVMTATPIPRTLSLTIFGDLDVSTIRGMPPGRTPITNRVVKPDQAHQVYEYLRTRLDEGEQAYVVVPTIDGAASESEKPLKSVREHAQTLQQTLGDGYVVETIHSQLPQTQRETVMERFRQGEVHVLVATTVIEVGVDVHNATMMIIEHAERFGLAQLHQLRGRIGRGTHGRASLCVFISEPTTEDAEQRMQAIAATNDGFRIAEQDLQIRGMGDFFGTRQSGLPPLRVADLPKDLELLQLAQRDAQHMIEQDTTLNDPAHQTLRRLLLSHYGEALGLIDVG
jgi:ATP-dependent DNA helicase RecG